MRVSVPIMYMHVRTYDHDNGLVGIAPENTGPM